MKHGQRLWSKTIQGGEFSTSFLLWITQSISLNIPSYIPLYVIYNHYSITCFASLSEENCAKIITPDECSGTRGSEKIAGHFFFYHTEFQMPKLNTDVLQTFLTYLPYIPPFYSKENFTCKAYNIYCTLKFLRIKRNPATAILRASTCLQKK